MLTWKGEISQDPPLHKDTAANDCWEEKLVFPSDEPPN